ncbi:MAG: hypothetical protein ACK55I_19185, partial [bacterium]
CSPEPPRRSRRSMRQQPRRFRSRRAARIRPKEDSDTSDAIARASDHATATRCVRPRKQGPHRRWPRQQRRFHRATPRARRHRFSRRQL